MTIPSEIQALIERLNQELDETERYAADGLNRVRPLLSRFPDNAILIQYFAYFKTALFFVETFRRQVETTVESISPDDVPAEDIQDAAEEFGTLLGRVLETKIRARRIINRLEELA